MQYHWIPDMDWPDGRRWLLTPVGKRPVDAVGAVLIYRNGMVNAAHFHYFLNEKDFRGTKNAARWLVEEVS